MTSAKPTVSVVVPNYNYASFLDERLESILGQTMRDHEIIFLDDASTDESVAIAKERFGRRIQLIEVNPVSSGSPFVQWNRGVQLAKGEFVWIAEADDLCTPDFLECLLEAVSRAPTIGLAYCRTVPIDSTGAIIDADAYYRYVSDLDGSRWMRDFTAHGRTEVMNYMGRKNTIVNVSGVLFRREAYVGAGYAPENLSMCGDWLTYCRILHNWDVAYVSAALDFHRQHPSKQTQKSVLNLTYFSEFLHVQAYVAQAFSLSGRDRRAAFRRFLGEWDRLTVSNYGRIGLAGTLKLARLAAQACPAPTRYPEIAAHLVINASRSLTGKCRTS